MSLSMRALILVPALLLAACEGEPENIQAKAENMSRQLETRADQIRSEAENEVAADVAALDNQADALLNQIGGNEIADANAAGNAQ
jgi:starvation-inducible outer membrane lipoprotein